MTILIKWNEQWQRYLKSLRLEHVFVLSENALTFLHGLVIAGGSKTLDEFKVNLGHTMVPYRVVTYELHFTFEQTPVFFFKASYLHSSSPSYWAFDPDRNTPSLFTMYHLFTPHDQKIIHETLNGFSFEKMIAEFSL